MSLYHGDLAVTPLSRGIFCQGRVGKEVAVQRLCPLRPSGRSFHICESTADWLLCSDASSGSALQPHRTKIRPALRFRHPHNLSAFEGNLGCLGVPCFNGVFTKWVAISRRCIQFQATSAASGFLQPVRWRRDTARRYDTVLTSFPYNRIANAVVSSKPLPARI